MEKQCQGPLQGRKGDFVGKLAFTSTFSRINVLDALRLRRVHHQGSSSDHQDAHRVDGDAREVEVPLSQSKGAARDALHC